MYYIGIANDKDEAQLLKQDAVDADGIIIIIIVTFTEVKFHMQILLKKIMTSLICQKMTNLMMWNHLMMMMMWNHLMVCTISH